MGLFGYALFIIQVRSKVEIIKFIAVFLPQRNSKCGIFIWLSSLYGFNSVSYTGKDQLTEKWKHGSYYTFLHYTRLCYIMLHQATLCYTMFYYAKLCYNLKTLLHHSMIYYIQHQHVAVYLIVLMDPEVPRGLQSKYPVEASRLTVWITLTS